LFSKFSSFHHLQFFFILEGVADGAREVREEREEWREEEAPPTLGKYKINLSLHAVIGHAVEEVVHGGDSES
jgi:hypothetical protein